MVHCSGIAKDRSSRLWRAGAPILGATLKALAGMASDRLHHLLEYKPVARCILPGDVKEVDSQIDSQGTCL
jgi:hypothetical protein